MYSIQVAREKRGNLSRSGFSTSTCGAEARQVQVHKTGLVPWLKEEVGSEPSGEQDYPKIII